MVIIFVFAKVRKIIDICKFFHNKHTFFLLRLQMSLFFYTFASEIPNKHPMKHILTIFICAICCSLYAAAYEAPLIDSGTRNKYVEVSVDGIKRRFTIDTGCSSLSINMQLLNELIRQNKVKLSDMSGEHNARMANGYMHVVRELMLSEFSLGGYTFRNVVAHVGINDAPDAPLLLGQSLLERMRWYRIAGNSIQFEPYDEAFQHALAIADFYSNDSIHQQEIATLLLPYERQGMLSCFFRQQLFYALYYTDAYDDAMSLAQKLREMNCLSDFDLTDYEIQLHYNQAVNLYNADHYEQALAIADKAWSLANSNDLYLRFVSNIGMLYWHIYHQLGNESKMKEFEKFKL